MSNPKALQSAARNSGPHPRHIEETEGGDWNHSITCPGNLA
jgi:hypothetical protein